MGTGAAIGWLRWVGSWKLHVSFAKEPYKRDGILQKRPRILRSLLIVTTAYLLHTLPKSTRTHLLAQNNVASSQAPWEPLQCQGVAAGGRPWWPVNDSWQKCMWMSHGTHMDESWHAYGWVMARTWMSHNTHMTESWHSYARAPLPGVVHEGLLMNQGTHVNE